MTVRFTNFYQTLVIASFSYLVSIQIAGAQTNPPALAGCTNDRFVIGTDNNEIKTAGTTYTPKCLKVKIGALVTIQATQRHPLLAIPDINGVSNPFASNESAITAQTRKMNVPGVFGYYCKAHGDEEGDGMAGVIIVEE